MKKLEMIEKFEPQVQIESPGRINLIGEHTDYNEGFAMPTAIDKKLRLEFRRNDSDTCRVYSETFKIGFEFKLRGELERGTDWENYIIGVVDQIQKAGKTIGGFDCIIHSNLPVGAGISSSAALECGIASGLNELFSLGLNSLEIVKLSQQAENDFVGSNCGIMDQYSSVFSKKDHLILLDCRTLYVEFIPANFKNCKLLLLNTNVAHNLADSEYNSRRADCEKAVLRIQEDYPKVNALRDVDMDTLVQYKDRFSKTIYQRCLYVMEENQRVLQAANSLRKGNLQEFGSFMYQSHEGLQNKYEVSCKELDFLVDYSRDKDFIYGSRMMGGGFGGCTLNLIEEDKIDNYVEEVSSAYREKFDIKLDAFSVLPDAGTQIIKNDYRL